MPLSSMNRSTKAFLFSSFSSGDEAETTRAALAAATGLVMAALVRERFGAVALAAAATGPLEAFADFAVAFEGAVALAALPVVVVFFVAMTMCSLRVGYVKLTIST
ncbi:MAG: hypothetical protein AB8B51_08370 [Sedimentitalea sp.]